MKGDTLHSLAQISKDIKDGQSRAVDLTLVEEGETFKAYEVSIAYGSLLFFTDKGVLDYVVDYYGDEPRVELYNIERDEAV